MSPLRRSPDAAAAYVLREFVEALAEGETRDLGVGQVHEDLRLAAARFLLMADAAHDLAKNNPSDGVNRCSCGNRIPPSEQTCISCDVRERQRRG